jgi:hypothetical protein
MNIIRRATYEELSEIHKMQDVPFRDHVFLEPLWPIERFKKETIERLENGTEHYFIHESDGSIAGFVRLLLRGDWEALTWGKWLNTLVYACGVVSFDQLNVPKLTFAVRDDNRRVLHLYQKFKFRKVSREFYPYRKTLFAPIQTINLTHFEITSEEFQVIRPVMRENSLLLTFA